MRQKKAKALRTASRPNPGRKHGGAGKVVMKTEAVTMADKNKKKGKS